MNYLDQAIVALNTKIALDPKQQDLAEIVDLLNNARTEFESLQPKLSGDKGIHQKPI